jgi:HK97 family phage prohead protease
MLLRKSLRLSDTNLKMSGESGVFEGYASVFGGVDSYGDTIEKGAFVETLKADGLPKMFFNHEWAMPIGKWTQAQEDSTGLYVKGELTPGLKLSDDIYAALKHGTLDGLSVGGFVKKADYEMKGEIRHIKKWSKLAEISPVAFPADAAARIESVKGADILELIENTENIREIEGLLRDAAGLSKGAAVALIARVKALSNAGDPQDIEAKAMQELAERFARLAA